MKAMGNKTPVVYTTTGELGMIEKVWPDGGSAFVLYLGSRLAKSTRLDDLVAVDNLAADSGGVVYVLHEAGKVHGGGLPSARRYKPTDDDKQDTP